MPDTWDQIHGPHGPAATGFTGRTDGPHQTPRVARPTCPETCSGRHVRDSVLGCPHCGGAVYEIIGHEHLGTEGHWWWERRPLSGAPDLHAGVKDPCCRDCGEALVRR